MPAILSQGGHQLVVHTIVTGGQSLADTLHGTAQLVKQLEDARFVVWLNPFWGPVSLDGKTFEQMKIYQDIKKRIESVVNLPAFTDELFPQDIASMLKSRLTFKEAIASPDQTFMSRHRLKVAQREFYSRLDSSGRMNNGIEAFRSQMQKELGLSIGPKDPLLALWVSQRELLEQNAAQQQKLLSEFQAALGKSQTVWSEQAKTLAQQSLNAALQAAQKSTALLLEEAARVNAAAVRQAFQEGVTRMEQVVSAGQQIAWLSLAASVVALTAAICAIFARVIH